ncbi:MAG: acyl-CoA dehydrogenase family protein [Acidimicrobiia bacterium]
MMDADELDLVRASMRELLARHAPAELPAQLLDGGWAELVGEGPATAISVLAEEQGRSLAVAPILDLVLLHGAGLQLEPDISFVLPPMRQHLSPIDGLVLAGHERAATFLVVGPDDEIFAVSPRELHFQPVLGSDPDLQLHRATGTVRDADTRIVAPPEAWSSALAAGRRSLASELIGLTERMLDDTVGYVLERHQFGRPIASFQTVKHRLADVRVAASAARAGLDTAWIDHDPTSALAAKCLAGRAHRLAATNCHQVHGGIAFTVEHGFHRFIRRGLMLDGLLGRADDLVSELGRHLLERGRVPRTPQLRTQMVPAG